MIVVVDTNVLVSGLWGGNPGQVINLWHTGNIRLAVSQPILNEYWRVLHRFELAAEYSDELSILFAHPAKTILVNAPATPAVIKEDPSDNKFLGCAAAAHADYIVSGDRHLLKLKSYGNISILKPAAFIRLFK